jgi:hypothetical protein
MPRATGARWASGQVPSWPTVIRTIRKSLACLRLKLWGEDLQQLVGFPD